MIDIFHKFRNSCFAQFIGPVSITFEIWTNYRTIRFVKIFVNILTSNTRSNYDGRFALVWNRVQVIFSDSTSGRSTCEMKHTENNQLENGAMCDGKKKSRKNKINEFLPVSMTPSVKKNSAACTVSSSDTSNVIECELCFFFKSVKMRMFSASICFRYRSKWPAQASVKPSSATCEKTNPSARINCKLATLAMANAWSFPQANTWTPHGVFGKICFISVLTRVIDAITSGPIFVFWM